MLALKVTVAITETNIKKLLSQMVVLVDSRENENRHITDYFNQHSVAYRVKAMECFDYSCEIKANPELGLPFDISLENLIGIERKGSGGSGISELCGNFTTNRNQFEEKWEKAKATTEDLYLVIENGSWDDIRNHRYKSDFGEKAFYNSLISWRTKYGFQIDFVNSDDVANHIIKLLVDKLKKVLSE